MKIAIEYDDRGYIMASAEVTFEEFEVSTIGNYNSYIKKILKLAEPKLLMEEPKPSTSEV